MRMKKSKEKEGDFEDRLEGRWGRELRKSIDCTTGY